MKNRGTGWIPDYPDINDFTLQSEALQNLTNRIQSQKEIGSIENLAGKVLEVLGILAETENADPNKKKLIEELQNGLEQEILGKNSHFVPVKLHNVFKEGMADSEVLLIKNYLQSIFFRWNFYNYGRIDNITNMMKLNDTTFDATTIDCFNQIIKTQQRLLPTADGSIGKDDVEVIKELAELSTIIRSPSLLGQDILDRWEKWLAPPTVEEIFTTFNFQHFQSGQILLIIHLFKLIKTVMPPSPSDGVLHRDMRVLERIEAIKVSLVKTIEYLEKHKGDIAKGLLCISKYDINYLMDYPGDLNKLREIVDKYKALSDKFDNSSISKSDDPWICISDVAKEELINKSLKELGKLVEDIKDFQTKLSPKINLAQTKNNLIKTSKENLTTEEKLIVDQASKLEFPLYEKIRKKYSEWDNLLKTVLQIIPPSIPRQSLDEKVVPVKSPLPEKLIELFKKKLIYEQYPVSKSTEIDETIQELINAIIDLFSQILMPVAKHSNLNQALDQVIKIIEFLFAEDDGIGAFDRDKRLFRQEVEEYNRDFTVIIENFDFLTFMLGLLLQNLELKIKDASQSSQSLQEIEEEKYKLKQYLKQVLDASRYRYPLIYSLVEKLDKYDDAGLEKLRKFVNIKKPLLEIKKIQQTTSIEPKENSGQQTENDLQFPINYQLRSQLKKSLKSQHQRVFLTLPEFVDLSYWCSPIEDQGSINSCTAHAGIALMEYFEKKSTGNYTDASPLFLYKATRNLMQREGDSGASVRDTIKAMVAFGVCPENYWSYDEAKFDEEPTPFCYSFAENYKTLKYFRLDYGRISRYALLWQIKVLLAAEFPCIFGFTLYKSVYDEPNTIKGHIPLPNRQDRVIGGHTVVAVGYHDRKIVENADGTRRSQGALLIRNSWGTHWGQGGYGWLPYDYVVEGLTADWWSVLKAEWLASRNFGAGASAWNADKGHTGGDEGDD